MTIFMRMSENEDELFKGSRKPCTNHCDLFMSSFAVYRRPCGLLCCVVKEHRLVFGEEGRLIASVKDTAGNHLDHPRQLLHGV